MGTKVHLPIGKTDLSILNKLLMFTENQQITIKESRITVNSNTPAGQG